MRIVTPSDEEIRRIQCSDARLYWSRLIGTIFEKHGLFVTSLTGPRASEIVTRQTPAAMVGCAPIIIEGPVTPDLLARFGLIATQREVNELYIEDARGAGFHLVYNRANVRRIPAIGVRTPTEVERYEPNDQRWAPKQFKYQELQGAGTPALYGVGLTGGRTVVAREVDGAIVLGFPIFDFLAQHHAAPPFYYGYYSMAESSDLEGLERWLIDAIVEHLLRRQISFARLSAWPHPYRACLSIRHDFDRRLNGLSVKVFNQRSAIKKLLSIYSRYNIKSTWFWRVFSFDRDLISMAAAAGHEIALHTDVPNGTIDEIDAEVEFFVHQGLCLKGLTAHGGAGSIGYTGLPQVEAALKHHMFYGELAGNATTLPCFAHVLKDDLLTATKLVMPAAHLSLDKSTSPADHYLPEVLEQSAAILRAGGHAVLMNHPDIHIPEMIEFCEKVDKNYVWRASFIEVASWYRSSRSLQLLVEGGLPVVRFAEPLSEAARVVIMHDGSSLEMHFPRKSLGGRFGCVEQAASLP